MAFMRLPSFGEAFETDDDDDEFFDTIAPLGECRLTHNHCPYCGNLLFADSVFVYSSGVPPIITNGLKCANCCYQKYSEELVQKIYEQMRKGMTGGVLLRQKKK